MRERFLFIVGIVGIAFLVTCLVVIWIAPVDPALVDDCEYSFAGLCNYKTFQGLIAGLLATVAAIVGAFAIWKSAQHTAKTALVQSMIERKTELVQVLGALAIEIETITSGAMIRGRTEYFARGIKHFGALNARVAVISPGPPLEKIPIPKQIFVVFDNNSQIISMMPEEMSDTLLKYYYSVIDYKALLDAINDGAYDAEGIAQKKVALEGGAETIELLEKWGKKIVHDLRKLRDQENAAVSRAMKLWGLDH